jgi:NDP-sugar pyrophosphorylase family protein
VELNDVHVNHIREKPSFTFFINAGAYLLEPEVCDFIPSGRRFDMTELIQELIEAGKVVVSFPNHGILARHRTSRRLREGPGRCSQRRILIPTSLLSLNRLD